MRLNSNNLNWYKIALLEEQFVKEAGLQENILSVILSLLMSGVSVSEAAQKTKTSVQTVQKIKDKIPAKTPSKPAPTNTNHKDFNPHGIVVHHSASGFKTTFEDVLRWHKERGWPNVGYHYLIFPDGSIKAGTPITQKGTHIKGHNKEYIGICLIGNEEFTPKQKQSLQTLVDKLGEGFEISSIRRHHEECPGKGINVGMVEQTFMAHLKQKELQNKPQVAKR